MDKQKYINLFQDELFDSIIPFWVHNMKDAKNGGVFTSLDRDGSVYSTDNYTKQ